MRHSSALVPYQWDQLVVRYRNVYTNERCSQGKRVGNDCPLTHEERRIYVEKGVVHAVKAIKDRLGCDLAEALRILNKARGVTNWSDHVSHGGKVPKAYYDPAAIARIRSAAQS